MFNDDARLARKKIASGWITLRWNGQSFVPDKMEDRNALELLQIKSKRGSRRWTISEIDEVLWKLGEADVGLETIGYPDE